MTDGAVPACVSLGIFLAVEWSGKRGEEPTIALSAPSGLIIPGGSGDFESWWMKR